MEKELLKKQRLKTILKIIAVLSWLLVILVLVLNRDKLSVEGIVNIAPSNMIAAILLFLLLFVLKCLTVVVYCAILYAASGLIFPIYIAIPVCFVGTAIMVTIPYFIGKKLGNDGIQELYKKYPKLNSVHEFRAKNDFLFILLLRALSIFPSDPLSAYIGASGMDYKVFLLGSLLGMSPEIVAFSVMGMSADNITSPAFLISLSVKVIMVIASFIIVRIKKNENSSL